MTTIDVAETVALLQSKWHEVRLLALTILVHQYERGDDAERAEIYRHYLANTNRINNWDLVDVSAHTSRLVTYGLYRFFTTVVNIGVGANIPLIK